MKTLKELIHQSRFEEAQQLCHRMHPFYSQLDAGHLCESLRKMDSLRGENEDAWPEWKVELLKTLSQLELFIEEIRKNDL